MWLRKHENRRGTNLFPEKALPNGSPTQIHVTMKTQNKDNHHELEPQK